MTKTIGQCDIVINGANIREIEIDIECGSTHSRDNPSRRKTRTKV